MDTTYAARLELAHVELQNGRDAMSVEYLKKPLSIEKSDAMQDHVICVGSLAEVTEAPTPMNKHTRLNRPSLPNVIACALLAALPAHAVHAKDADAPKTHTLFMGTNISVEQGKQLYQLQDVNGRSFVISVNGKPTLVPMDGPPRNLQVTQELKLTADSAAVTKLVTERAYTPGRDPRLRRQLDQVRVTAAIGDNASLAQGQMIAAANNFGVVMKQDSTSAGAGTTTAAAQGNAFQAEQVADRQMASDMTSGAFYAQKAEEDLALGLFDAIEVNFEISSETTLEKPFMVIVLHYKEKDAKPNEVRNMIYARALESIGPKPREIHVLQGGLPLGFEVVDSQVHLYNDGAEIATDVAPKRVPLTRDEAFRYALIEYLGSHKKSTVDASPIIGRLTEAERTQISDTQFTAAYFVKVTKDGLPEAAFVDENCSRPVDPQVETLVDNVRFYPALHDGRQVAGVARLKFAELGL